VSGALASALDLRPALRRTAERGYAHVAHALDPAACRALWREVARGPLRRFADSFGQVRQEIEGFDVLDPMDGWPAIGGLRDELVDLIRRHGRGIRGLATWWPNEAGIAVYRPSSIGITPHLDGKKYRRLVAVVTIRGTARFTVCRDRAGEVVERWWAGAGGLTLMRGPGLVGKRDGRPFHTVEGPRRGERCSIGLRMDARPVETVS
jgi:hypothetical protein